MTTIVFGSCMNFDGENGQKAWTDARAHNADWLILGGDNIYMDFGLSINAPRHWSPAKFASEMLERYSKQFRVKAFRKLVQTINAGQVIGTWDDHDFGWNNCHGAQPEYDMPAKRIIARVLFHHYFKSLNIRPLPPSLPPIDITNLSGHPDAGRDIYYARDIGPFRALICDCRFYRERQTEAGQMLGLLGPAQERWLLDEIRRATKPLMIISGSVLTDAGDQSWDFFQDFYRNRFLPAIDRKIVLFVGGDIHKNRLSAVSGTKLTEVVSSGISVLGVSRRHGVLRVDDDQVGIFLYRKTEIEIPGSVNLATGTLRTAPRADGDKPLTVLRARRQQAMALSRIRSSRSAKPGLRPKKPR